MTPRLDSFLPGEFLPWLAGAALTLPVAAQKATSPSAESLASFYRSAAWQQFLADHGGEWRIEWCAATGTPAAIWGSGLPLADWRENSLAEARRHAHQLLREQADLLGLGSSEFRETIGSRMSRTWVFVFDQYFRGVPVVDGRADVRVHMVGRVPMFGSKAARLPADFNVTPALDSATAEAIAWAALAQAPTDVRQPGAPRATRLVIDGDVHAAAPTAFRLAWEVPVSNVDAAGNGPIGRYYVDAVTGAVLRFVDDKHECGLAGCTVGQPTSPAAAPTNPSPASPPVLTTVTVRGWTRTGNDALDPLVDVPLPGLELTVPGIGAVTTDQNGQFTINIGTPVSIAVGALDGRHHQAIAGADAPSGNFTVNPGVATTITLLTSGASPNQAAHTTTSWWTDRTNEFARAILGNTPQLATASNVAVTVNIASSCNAYYTGNSINFYSAGGGCSNTAFSTVVAHEWGHGIDDRYGGISQTDGLSEGWGDICGLYLADSPILGSGFSTGGVGIRNGNNTLQFPAGGGVHTQGQTWMGFAWKLRDRMATTLGNRPAAIALTNDIVVSTLAADATDQVAAVREVFIADDDNGNLADGTPHSADLIWACNQHSLPYPGLPTAPNEECSGAIALVNGLNGPFTNVGSFTSAPGWACASGGNDIWFLINVGSNGTLQIDTCGQATWDTALELFTGSCGGLLSIACNDDSCSLQSSVSAAVSPGTYYLRAGGWNGATGTFSLNVNGPAGIPAAVATFGAGCGTASKAFYELFPSTGFDLSGVAMRLVRSGNHYIAQPGGTYVAPSPSAVQLALTDDSVTTVNLAGILPYPGSGTAALEVCSNGFVSVAAGNGNAWTPAAAGWLGSVQARWGCWHDWNPVAPGSGKVKFEQIGMVAYVTWDGVYSYNTTAPNTWQLQFDLNTGNVTYVFQSMVASGNGWLVGYAAAAPNTDLGNLDLSAALPGTFRTSADNAVALASTGTLPQLGTTLTLTSSNYPASSLLGLQLVGLQRFDPGIDLAILGMPGCLQHASLESLTPVFPVGGQASYLLPIPNNPSLMGFQLTGQAVAFVNGVNSAGLVTSNGVALTLGQ